MEVPRKHVECCKERAGRHWRVSGWSRAKGQHVKGRYSIAIRMVAMMTFTIWQAFCRKKTEEERRKAEAEAKRKAEAEAKRLAAEAEVQRRAEAKAGP